MITTQHASGTRHESSSDHRVERRQHRRHDMEQQQVPVEKYDARRHTGTVMGRVVDLSSGGIRIRTRQGNIQPDQQIRLRLALPSYAGISPFLDTSSGSMRPKTEWVGWLAVSRVHEVRAGEYDVAGRLMDMEDLDRGMLSLYLSTQPLAA